MRLSEQVALAVGAAAVADGLELAGCLDSLSDRVQIEPAGQADEQFEHRAVAGRGGAVAAGGGGHDERAVDLRLVDGQVVQTGEGGVAV